MTRRRIFALDTRRRAWLRRGLMVVLLLVALLRPGLPGGSAQAATSELNVFFVVDTTSSMVAEDYGNAGPRMDGVRQDVMAIAEQLPGARFAMITFDTKGHVRMPLTTDTLALETITSVLEPQVTAYAKGSSITAARRVLAERLAAAQDSHPDRPRLVFYFGDGEQTSAQQPQPLDLDAGLVAGGAVLGYGTAAGGRMKENTGTSSDGGTRAGEYLKDRSGEPALSVVDEGRLRDIAAQLHVPYIHRSAGDPAAAMMAQASPGALERTQDNGSLAGRTELYWLFAGAAFVFGLAEVFGLVRHFRELRPAPHSSAASASGVLDTSGRGPGPSRGAAR